MRFLSCEPLLGQLDLSTLVQSNADVNWIIAGGESGPGARPMAPVWVRSLRDFAKKRKIAFHFKQWGHWSPEAMGASSKKAVRLTDGVVLYPIGKRVAGRRLDGETWDQLPSTEM